MARKEVTKHELVSIINHELSMLEDCPGLRINGITSLSTPDPKGCNWIQPVISCKDFPISGGCSHAANQVIAWAKNSFNLRQE